MASTVTELLRRRFGGKSLPYDAEVEYLQSNGNQYIDTGLKCNLETEINVVAMRGSSSTYFCGTDSSNTTSITIYASANGNQRFGDKVVSVQTSANVQYTIKFNKTEFKINNITRSVGATTSFVSDNNLLLFRRDAASAAGEVKIYSFSMYDNGVLVRDMIPVRKATTGYMYDRVSGQLFGNAGTGDFILGNDIN